MVVPGFTRPQTQLRSTPSYSSAILLRLLHRALSPSVDPGFPLSLPGICVPPASQPSSPSPEEPRALTTTDELAWRRSTEVFRGRGDLPCPWAAALGHHRRSKLRGILLWLRDSWGRNERLRVGSSILCPQIFTDGLTCVRCSEYTQLRVWLPVDTPVFN